MCRFIPALSVPALTLREDACAEAANKERLSKYLPIAGVIQ
jgi:hypothetical protein